MKNTDQPKPSHILSPQERHQRNRDEMYNAILATALEIMRQDGVGALNLHELARRIGMRTSSLYVYFPNKLAIYDALFLMGVRLYRAKIQELLGTPDDPWEVLHAIFEANLEMALHNPELFQLVYERPIPGFVPSEESLAEMVELEREGILLFNRVHPIDNPDRVLPAAHGLILAMAHGLTALHLANDPHLPLDRSRFGSLVSDAVTLFKSAWGKTPYPGS